MGEGYHSEIKFEKFVRDKDGNISVRYYGGKSMDRLIEYLAHKLYDITQRHVRWGSISLPRGCQLNFRIDGKCYLEVVESGGVVRTSEIDIVDEYGWLKPEDLEEEIWGVFEGIEFTNKQVNRHLKSIGV